MKYAAAVAKSISIAIASFRERIRLAGQRPLGLLALKVMFLNTGVILDKTGGVVARRRGDESV